MKCGCLQEVPNDDLTWKLNRYFGKPVAYKRQSLLSVK